MKRILLSASALLMALVMIVGLAVPAYADAVAPIAENLELTTCRNTSVGGELSAFADSEAELRYELTTKPVKGEVTLSDDGSFVYTPKRDKKGKDYFGYRAIDALGNSSQEATVIINIKKQKPCVKYSDMEGNAAEYAAVLLCEKGVYTGKQLCGHYLFGPDESVTRGEFLSMCMELIDSKGIVGVMRTGYADDDAIPLWMKGYVAAAAMNGFDASADEAVFSYDALITKTEAAVMVNGLLGLKAVSYVDLNEALDENTAQACANLDAYGIIKEGHLAGETLSRSEAAQLLVSAMQMSDR